MANDKNAKILPALIPAQVPEPTGFPMSLREFAVTVKLDVLEEAGIAATTLPYDRTIAEWKEALEAFRTRPVSNS